ncbi:MAG: LysR family transcriptional regulator [Peptococcaceae bacterium]|nr:LysR family transcriptional regulator [Peptococcaceae bacterium]
MAHSTTDGDSLLHVGYKLWLAKNGDVCFGEGIFTILSHVAALGSISRAAWEMNMSYRAAWGKIKTAELRWGLPLVITQVGGELGGGARLTPEAEELLTRYRRLQEAVDTFVQKSFREVFRDWPPL